MMVSIFFYNFWKQNAVTSNLLNIILPFLAVDKKQADLLKKIKNDVAELKSTFAETSNSLTNLVTDKDEITVKVGNITNKYSSKIQNLSDALDKNTKGHYFTKFLEKIKTDHNYSKFLRAISTKKIT